MGSPGNAGRKSDVLYRQELREYDRRIEKCESQDPFDTPLSPAFVRATKLLAGAGKYAWELVCAGQYDKPFSF